MICSFITKNYLAKRNLYRKIKQYLTTSISEWNSLQNTCSLTFFGACISNNETNCDAFMVLHQCFISSVIYCKIFCCFSVYSCFNIWELLSSPSLISKWSLGQSKMRPDWHTGREGKGREYSGRRANAGTALWLRAPSLFDLQSVTCARFWQIWKKLAFPDRGLTPGGLKLSKCISEQRCDFAQVEQKGRDGD